MAVVFGLVVGIGPRCWLFGHECVLATVGFALESDETSVVDGAVDEGRGHVLVSRDASPAAGFDVGGVDDVAFLVAGL